jgi:hypothetical protein
VITTAHDLESSHAAPVMNIILSKSKFTLTVDLPTNIDPWMLVLSVHKDLGREWLHIQAGEWLETQASVR